MAADLSNLLRGAARLKALSGEKKLPALLFLTDPDRIPDPIGALEGLPKRTNRQIGVIYRHFGDPERLEIARKLKTLCRRRRWILLIGADAPLAVRIRADGVHLPERLTRNAKALKRRRPAWIVTAAAHSRTALKRIGAVDAVLLSPVFPTDSQSAKNRKLLHRRGLAQAAFHANSPLYALGGVNGQTIQFLENITGVSGAALVSGLFSDA